MEGRKHNQYEAFMLMQYECDSGHKETIWNSRDGVTPFIIGCPHEGCKADMVHTNFAMDTYAPDHVPKKGDRIFTDLTPEKAREYRQKYVDEWWDKLIYDTRMKDHYESKADAVEKLVKADMDSFAPHTPTVTVVE